MLLKNSGALHVLGKIPSTNDRKNATADVINQIVLILHDYTSPTQLNSIQNNISFTDEHMLVCTNYKTSVHLKHALGTKKLKTPSGNYGCSLPLSSVTHQIITDILKILGAFVLVQGNERQSLRLNSRYRNQPASLTMSPLLAAAFAAWHVPLSHIYDLGDGQYCTPCDWPGARKKGVYYIRPYQFIRTPAIMIPPSFPRTWFIKKGNRLTIEHFSLPGKHGPIVYSEKENRITYANKEDCHDATNFIVFADGPKPLGGDWIPNILKYIPFQSYRDATEMIEQIECPVIFSKEDCPWAPQNPAIVTMEIINALTSAGMTVNVFNNLIEFLSQDLPNPDIFLTFDQYKTLGYPYGDIIGTLMFTESAHDKFVSLRDIIRIRSTDHGPCYIFPALAVAPETIATILAQSSKTVAVFINNQADTVHCATAANEKGSNMVLFEKIKNLMATRTAMQTNNLDNNVEQPINLEDCKNKPYPPKFANVSPSFTCEFDEDIPIEYRNALHNIRIDFEKADIPFASEDESQPPIAEPPIAEPPIAQPPVAEPPIVEIDDEKISVSDQFGIIYHSGAQTESPETACRTNCHVYRYDMDVQFCYQPVGVAVGYKTEIDGISDGQTILSYGIHAMARVRKPGSLSVAIGQSAVAFANAPNCIAACSGDFSHSSAYKPGSIAVSYGDSSASYASRGTIAISGGRNSYASATIEPVDQRYENPSTVALVLGTDASCILNGDGDASVIVVHNDGAKVFLRNGATAVGIYYNPISQMVETDIVTSLFDAKTSVFTFEKGKFIKPQA